MTDSQSANSEPESNIDLDAILAKWRWLVPADTEVLIKWDMLESTELKSYRAQCLPDTRNNRLLIKVAHDEGPVDQWGFELPRDVEADVVHELIHWRFDLFTPEEPSAEYELWEAAVERTAQDLLKLHRSNQ